MGAPASELIISEKPLAGVARDRASGRWYHVVEDKHSPDLCLRRDGMGTSLSRAIRAGPLANCSYYTRVMHSLVAAVVTLLLFAPSAGAAEHVIVAFGDSLTAGLGVTPENSYPARLQAKVRAEGYDYRVVNAGASGDTTAGGLRRVD